MKEIFYTLPQDDIEKALVQYGFTEAVDQLLLSQEKVHLTCLEDREILHDQGMQLQTENSKLEVISIEVI